jgi:putative ABC transport system substrate-binding protein
MNSSLLILATIFGLCVLSLVYGVVEIWSSMWIRHKAQLAARREQLAALPVIGFLSSRSRDESRHLLAAFQRSLNENSYFERENLTIEYRWADGQYERLPALAVELADRSVAVLVSVGGEPAAVVAQAATSTIPIVAIFSDDAAATGIVTSRNRPNINVTGVSSWSAILEPTRLGLLRQLVPQATTVGILLNGNNPRVGRQFREMREAARVIGIELRMLRASTDYEIDRAFDSVAQDHIPALVVGCDSFFNTRRHKLVALAARYAVPAIYSFRESGLMSYGIDLGEAYRQLGAYTCQILKGAKLSELPIVQPSTFELVINLRTARKLGIDVPCLLLARANEVIE